MNRKDYGYQFARFVLTWIIFFHHVLTTGRDQGMSLPFLINKAFSRPSGGLGQMAVAMFFLLSGALMWRNHQELEIGRFYRKRIFGILIPIWICSIPLIIVDYLVNPSLVLSAYARHTILFNFLGLDLYLGVLTGIYPYHVAGEWFTSVILTMYILYPLLKKLFSEKKIRVISTVVITAVFVVNFKIKLFTMGNGWYSFSVGLFYFWCGMLYEKYRDKLIEKKPVIISSIVFVAVYLFYNMLPFVRLSSPAVSLTGFIVLNWFGNRIGNSINGTAVEKIIDFTCKNSYMIYLTHHYIIITLMKGFLLAGLDLFWLFVVSVIIIVCIYSVLCRTANDFVLKKIGSRKK